MTQNVQLISLLFSSAFILLIGVSSFAMSAEMPETDDIESIVVTNSRYSTNVNDISRSINFYHSQLIEQTQVDHIQQVLNQQSGIFLNRNSGQEMLLAIRSPVLTGAGACGSFLTMENGVPLRPNGFCNVNELFESHYELAERIEVIKGPSSAFYGSGGLHGVVNIINSASISRAPFIKMSFGQWGYQQVSFLANTPNNALSASISHDDGYRNESGFEQQKLSYHNVSDLQGIDIDTHITATNLNQETAGYIVGLNSYKSERLSKINPNPEAYRNATAVRASQRYDFNNGVLITPFIRYSEMAFLQHFVPGQPIEKNHHHSLGVQNQYQSILSEKLRLDMGVDLEFARISLLEDQENSTDGSPFLVATIPQGKHYDYEVDAFTVATFLSANYQLNTMLQITGGFRFENVGYNYTNNMNVGRVDESGNECGFGGCRFNRPANRDDNFTIASPKLGLVYRDEQSAGFINISHGFRAPQTTELYRLQREQAVSELEPEELLGIDTSWTSIAGNIEYSLQAYWYEKTNVILRDSDFYYVSNGETDHRGVELSFSAGLTNRFHLDGNIGYSKHTYLNNPNLSTLDIVGNEIANAPNFIANVRAGYQQDTWQISLNAQFIEQHYLNAENTSSYEGHTLLHLHAQYQLANKLILYVNVDNLFDKRYAERANYSNFTGERYFPGQPRNIKASFKYEF